MQTPYSLTDTRKRTLPVLLFWLGSLASLTAATLHVSPGGNNAASGLTWAAAKQNVTNAMAAARAFEGATHGFGGVTLESGVGNQSACSWIWV